MPETVDSPWMRIAVISDTHDSYPPELPGRLTSADEIWHLGDVSSPAQLVEFADLRVPLRVIMGNCDWTPTWPLTLTREIHGWRFHLVHIPPAKAPAGAHAVLHGHTHVPRDETDPLGVRWLNPGAVTNPRGGSKAGFAWLTVEESGFTWELRNL